jgi:acetyltransferase-like isoleucine patch superfamily enzyme/coenzyme F420-reducing hydrogenase beta subunit
MININDKVNCNGCCACVDVCPTNAIALKTDIEGFWYPEVKHKNCTDCGLCEKVCPELHIAKLKKNDYETPICYAAINKNMKVRWDSTSGGLFSAMAEKMYEQGGYVSGAVYNEDFSVRNFISNNPDDLPRLRSSKYLQSKAEGLYKEIGKLIKSDKKVLACGTPCQMTALRSFLGKETENLIIVDFVCRGVNSPKVYRKYLNSLEEQHGGKVVYVKAKNKELGWRSLARKVVFDNGSVYYGAGMDDPFRRGYHVTNAYCRPSCYACNYKDFPRIADITIADFWGIEKVNKNLDNNIGTSLVMVNSKKGEYYFASIADKIEFERVSFESILPGNPALVKPLSPSKINREKFFNELDNYSFTEITETYFPNKKQRKSKRQKIKAFLKFGLQMKRNLGFNPGNYMRFVWLNFVRKNSYTNLRKNQLIYPTSHTVFDIHPSAQITIQKDVIMGLKAVKGSKLESRLRMEAETQLTIDDGPATRYGDGSNIWRYGFDIQIVNGGKLIVGQGAFNMNIGIMCAHKITIGNGVRIGRDVTIRDWNGPHVVVSENYKNHAPVKIENHVWIASGATIMPGVTIGEGSVIASNAVVTKDVPARSMIAGVPAKVVKENIEWY